MARGFTERKVRKTSRLNSGTSGGALKGNFAGDSGATPKFDDKSYPLNRGKGKLDEANRPDALGKRVVPASKHSGTRGGALQTGFTPLSAESPRRGTGNQVSTGMHSERNALEGSNASPMAKRVLSQSDALKQSQTTFSDQPKPPKATGVPVHRKADGKSRNWHKELGFC